MSIKNIHLTNFRRFSEKDLDFHTLYNLLSGANGVGKTTIREAICFVFMGTDSTGSRNPTHLIQEGKGLAEAIITTDKAIIKRTITRKGTHIIELIREGVSNTLKQSQIEDMLGSTNFFLSVLVPGYFDNMTEQKKQKVLSEVLPEVNRHALLKEMVGFDLTELEYKKYDLRKRSDLVANTIATDRRYYEREADRLAGQISILKNVNPLPEPKKPEGNEVEGLIRMNRISDEWNQYDHEMKSWKFLKRQWSRQVEDNESCSEESGRIQKTLDALVSSAPPPLVPVDNRDRINEIGDKLRKNPEEPLAAKITDMEVCSSCGQIVGAKHRERIRDDNKRLVEKYTVEMQSVSEYNKPLFLEISKLKEEEALSLDSCRQRSVEITKFHAQRESLLRKLQQFKEIQVINLPKMPTEPVERVDPDEIRKLESLQNNYMAKLTEYNYVKNQRDKANKELEGYHGKIYKIAQSSKRLRTLEIAVRELPIKELKKQTEALKMPTVDIVMGERIAIFKDNTPCELLSTGNKMRAYVEISLMLNRLSKKCPNVIFLDDADLVDNCKFASDGVQFFITNVTSESKLTIGGINAS